MKKNITKLMILLGVSVSLGVVVTTSVDAKEIPTQTEIDAKVEEIKSKGVTEFKDVTKDMTVEQKLSDNIFVIDDTGTLTQEQKIAIYELNKNMVEQLNGKPQIVVEVVQSLPSGSDIDDFKNKEFARLGIGNKDHDNGLLVALAIDERKIGIEVGYGLEDVITDSQAVDILSSDEVLPHLKNNDFGTGILETVKILSEELKTSSIGTNQAEVDSYLSGIEFDKTLNSIGNFFAKLIMFVIVGAVTIFSAIFGNNKYKEIKFNKAKKKELANLETQFKEINYNDSEIVQFIIEVYNKNIEDMDDLPIDFSRANDKYERAYKESFMSNIPHGNKELRDLYIDKLDFNIVSNDVKSYLSFVNNVENKKEEVEKYISKVFKEPKYQAYLNFIEQNTFVQVATEKMIYSLLISMGRLVYENKEFEYEETIVNSVERYISKAYEQKFEKIVNQKVTYSFLINEFNRQIENKVYTLQELDNKINEFNLESAREVVAFNDKFTEDLLVLAKEYNLNGIKNPLIYAKIKEHDYSKFLVDHRPKEKIFAEILREYAHDNYKEKLSYESRVIENKLPYSQYKLQSVYSFLTGEISLEDYLKDITLPQLPHLEKTYLALLEDDRQNKIADDERRKEQERKRKLKREQEEREEEEERQRRRRNSYSSSSYSSSSSSSYDSGSSSSFDSSSFGGGSSGGGGGSIGF